MAADIVLKNKNGNPVSYSPVPNQIAVEGHDNENEETTYKYTRMAIMYCYAVKPGSGGYLVTKEILRLGSDDYWYTGFNENDLKEYGFQNDDSTWRINIFITTKRLTVGNTYVLNDMY